MADTAGSTTRTGESFYPLHRPGERVSASPSLPAIEEEVLEYWKRDQTFQASVDARPAHDADGRPNEFVFYDGPPFANGLPHYGHFSEKAGPVSAQTGDRRACRMAVL